jgi:hypothetical protein
MTDYIHLRRIIDSLKKVRDQYNLHGWGRGTGTVETSSQKISCPLAPAVASSSRSCSFRGSPKGEFLLLSNSEDRCLQANSITSCRREPEISCLHLAKSQVDKFNASGMRNPSLDAGMPLVLTHSINSTYK